MRDPHGLSVTLRVAPSDTQVLPSQDHLRNAPRAALPAWPLPTAELWRDTTIDAKELNSLKDTLQQNLSFLPDNALVGIVSYGMHVEVHELTTSDISRSYVFNGKKEYATSKVADMLGLRGTVAQTQVLVLRNLDRRSARPPRRRASSCPSATAR